VRVEQGLQELEGVHKASVNFATEKATVEYDSSALGIETITRKVKDLGYEVVGMEKSRGGVEAARKRELKELKTRFSVGVILSVVIFSGSMQHWFPYLRSIPRQTIGGNLFTGPNQDQVSFYHGGYRNVDFPAISHDPRGLWLEPHQPFDGH
jgi:Cu+-exporting ATPase